MSKNWDWEWIERINGDLAPFHSAAEELEMVLCEYLGEEPQSGPTYDVPEPPAPELEPIGEKHEIRLAVIEVEAQCEILYGRRFLPEDGLDLWKQLRHCNGDEENDGQRREKIVKKFRRWVSRLAGKLSFILGSRGRYMTSPLQLSESEQGARTDKTEQGEGNGRDNLFCFASSGSVYYIEGFGERGYMRKLKGFGIIARLIEAPKQAVLMRTLSQGKETTVPADSRTQQQTLDGQAKRELFDRLKEVENDLERAKEDNDTVEQQHCEEEIDKLKGQLSAALGLGGKSRDLNSEADKLRPNIHSNLARAYKALREAKPPMKELADHFEAAISAQSASYIYRPAGNAPTWSLDLPSEVAQKTT